MQNHTISHTMMIVRPDNRQAQDRETCLRLGWQPLSVAPLRVVALPDARARLARCAQSDAVFWVSPSAVEIGAAAFSGSLKDWAQPQVAVGAVTAQCLRERGARDVYFPENGHDSEAVLALPLWRVLSEKSRIAVVRGEGGRDWLAQKWHAMGFDVAVAEIYRREVNAVDWAAFERANPVAAWVTSGDLARSLFAQSSPKFTQKLHSLLYFAHHERICATLLELGARSVFCVPDLESAINSLNHRYFI